MCCLKVWQQACQGLLHSKLLLTTWHQARLHISHIVDTRQGLFLLSAHALNRSDVDLRRTPACLA